MHKRKTLMSCINPQTDWINNQKDIDTSAIEAFLPDVVAATERELFKKKQQFNEKYAPIVRKKLEELDALREKQLSLFEDSMPKANLKPTDANKAKKPVKAADVKRQARKEYIEKCFAETKDYVSGTYELDNRPYVQVVAVFTGKPMMPMIGIQTAGGDMLTIF